MYRTTERFSGASRFGKTDLLLPEKHYAKPDLLLPEKALRKNAILCRMKKN